MKVAGDNKKYVGIGYEVFHGETAASKQRKKKKKKHCASTYKPRFKLYVQMN